MKKITLLIIAILCLSGCTTYNITIPGASNLVTISPDKKVDVSTGVSAAASQSGAASVANPSTGR